MRQHLPSLVYISLFFVYMLSQVVPGANAFFLIHDNLDSEILFRLLPVRAEKWSQISNDVMIDQVMNGIPRNCFVGSVSNFITLLFAIFSPLVAYLINFVIVKSVAFFGLWFCLKRSIFANGRQLWVEGALALAFALLPFYTIYGLTVIALPVLYVAINEIVKNGRSMWPWIILVIYPFYSSFVLGGYAVIGIVFLFAFYFGVRKDFGSFKKMAGIGSLMLVLFFVGDVNLFNQFLFARDFVSHRSEWVLASYNWKVVAYSVYDMFLHGHYHSPSWHICLLVGIVVIGIATFRQFVANKFSLFLLGYILFAVLFFGLYKWDPVVDIRNKVSLLKTFQFDRFYFLLPAAWILLFAQLASTTTVKWQKATVLVFAVANLALVVFHQPELRSNLSGHAASDDYMTWNDYYNPELFSTIKNDIGTDQKDYRVAAIGFDPAVLQFNGFYTLDSYQNNYPLKYKHQFREIISSELEKDAGNRKLFDEWGSKCIVLTHAVNEQSGMLEHLDLNYDAFKKMGGRFLFSTKKIELLNLPMRLLKEYPNSYIGNTLYLYEVNDMNTQ